MLKLKAETVAATQLHVHGVPVFPGYIPLAIVRRVPNGSVSAFVAECHRQRTCCLAVAAAADAAGARHGKAARRPACWPPCREDRVARCANALPVNTINSSAQHSQKRNWWSA